MSLLFFCAMMEFPLKLIEKLRESEIHEPPRILVVCVAEQTMTLFQERKAVSKHAISTARNGTGQKADSYQTPLGLHRIKEKIGKDAPLGAIFENRKFGGQIWVPPSVPPQDAAENELESSDLITSRILWLEGLEPGVNSGSNLEGVLVDSYQRFIYIHGTNQEHHIGKSKSRGCIRMINSEIVPLFDRIEEGDLVWITP